MFPRWPTLIPILGVLACTPHGKEPELSGPLLAPRPPAPLVPPQVRYGLPPLEERLVSLDAMGCGCVPGARRGLESECEPAPPRSYPRGPRIDVGLTPVSKVAGLCTPDGRFIERVTIDEREALGGRICTIFDARVQVLRRGHQLPERICIQQTHGHFTYVDSNRYHAPDCRMGAARLSVGRQTVVSLRPHRTGGYWASRFWPHSRAVPESSG